MPASWPRLQSVDFAESLCPNECRMPKKSAGLMLYRRAESGPEILLVHPGGPFWRKKDEGAWTVPKGEFTDAEDPLAAAKREFEEETGAKPPAGEFIKLKPIRQANSKIVHAWA